MTPTGQYALRNLIEDTGIVDVLDTISGICGKIAERERNDKNTHAASEWERAESAIDVAIASISDK